MLNLKNPEFINFMILKLETFKIPIFIIMHDLFN